jgi:hypothetical protein
MHHLVPMDDCLAPQLPAQAGSSSSSGGGSSSLSTAPAGLCSYRLEDIAVWRIVHDNGAGQLSAQAVQVLHIVALVGTAGLPEQPPPDQT